MPSSGVLEADLTGSGTLQRPKRSREGTLLPLSLSKKKGIKIYIYYLTGAGEGATGSVS